jgi:hypothetical protein
MCELLVHARNRGPGRGQRGMVQAVQRDGFGWGRLEGPPNYYVVELPGVPEEEMRKYVGAWIADDGTPTNRREWLLDIDALPAHAQEALAKSGRFRRRVGDLPGQKMFRSLRTGQKE